MATLSNDFRFAFRLLRKSPVFTIVAVATLALAIAANTVIFTGVNAVLLRPLPYANPDQLVRVYTQFPTMDLPKFAISSPEYLDLERETRTFSSVAAWISSTARRRAPRPHQPRALPAVVSWRRRRATAS